MLALLMRFGENLKQFLADRDWLALMADHLSALTRWVRITC